MSKKVLTAPLAIIKSGGVSIGKMQNVRVQETISRGRIQGLGNLTPEDRPPISWDGTLSCSFFFIDLAKSTIPNVLNRKFTSTQDFVDALTLLEEGVQVILYKKTARLEGGVVVRDLKEIATIDDLLIEGDGFDINEASITSKNQSFSYLSPILLPV